MFFITKKELHQRSQKIPLEAVVIHYNQLIVPCEKNDFADCITYINYETTAAILRTRMYARRNTGKY